MFREHEEVLLTEEVWSDERLRLGPGDVGTVVHVHPGAGALVVEFIALDGDTVAIATVLPTQARPVSDRDTTHARHMETAN